jgi:hypothetical protein
MKCSITGKASKKGTIRSDIHSEAEAASGKIWAIKVHMLKMDKSRLRTADRMWSLLRGFSKKIKLASEKSIVATTMDMTRISDLGFTLPPQILYQKPQGLEIVSGWLFNRLSN